MRRFLLLLLVSLPGFSALPASDYQLDKVVELSRHGIRPPTAENRQEIERATGRAWPGWSTPDGELTAHGRGNIVLKARAQADRYRALKLFSGRCPSPDEVYVRASPLQRTIATAQAMMAGAFPGCTIAVHHQSAARPDPLFQAEKLPFARLDARRYRAALEEASNDLPQRQQAPAPALAPLRQAVCAHPTDCKLFDARWQLRQTKSGGWYVQGLSTLAAMVETLRMAWSENLPASQVAFGQLTRAGQLRQLLPLLTLSYDLSNDLPYLAQRRGSLLLSTLLAALSDPPQTVPDTRWLLLVAHDTNIAAVRTLMDFHWQLPGYNPGNIPPGGSLVLERWHQRSSGQRFIRLYFQAQSLEQLRGSQPPDSADPLLRQEWQQPGCLNTNVGILCPYQAALKALSARIDPSAKTRVEWH